MSQDTENVVRSETSANETSEEPAETSPLEDPTVLVQDALKDVQKVGAIWSDMGFGVARAAMDAVSETVATVTGETTEDGASETGEAPRAEETQASGTAPVDFVQGAIRDAQRVGEIWTGVGFGQARSAVGAVSDTLNVGKGALQRLRDKL